MTDNLRQRIIAALCDANPLLAGTGYSRRVEEYTDAVLAVVRADLDQARADADASLKLAQQYRAALEEVRAEVERLRDQTAAWKAMRGAWQRKAVAAEAEVERLRAAVQQALEERDHHSDRADTAESAVERARHLADQWKATGAWTVLGSDGTESAAAELRAALDDPTAEERAHADLVRLDEQLGLYPDQQP